MTVLVELLIILALIVVNGVFAGAEIAVISLRRTRVDQLVEEGRRGAQAVARLRADPERFLATVQVGITVVGATAAAFGGATLAGHIAPYLARLGPLAPWADQVSLVLVIVVVSYLSLVVGELVPKSLALRLAEPYALLIARPFEALSQVARPVVWLLVASSNVVLRAFRDSTSFTEARLSRDELLQLVDEAASTGSVDAHAGEIATRALSLDSLDAEDVMVGRGEIVAVPVDVDADHLHALAEGGTHVRMPVMGRDLDDLLGVVYVREALAAARDRGRVDLRPLLRPVPHVPEWTTATELLRIMRRERARMAIVVDEHGTTRGLVAVEDLVEELIGDVVSDDLDAGRPWVEEDADRWLIEGRAAVYEVNRDLGLALPEDESYATIGGLCAFLAGRIPAVGTRLEPTAGLRLEVTEATRRRVLQVRLQRVEEAPDPASPSEQAVVS